MATTTNLALPYPAATDLISQGYAQIQSLATSVDNYYGAWTGWSHGTAGVAFTNVTSGTISGRYRIIGKIVHCHFSILTGTATALGAISLTLPTAMPLPVSGQVTPIPALLTVGGAQTSLTSARMENGTRQISIYATTGGGNFAAAAAVTSSFNWTYEAA